jgi:hypothetical protein
LDELVRFTEAIALQNIPKGVIRRHHLTILNGPSQQHLCQLGINHAPFHHFETPRQSFIEHLTRHSRFLVPGAIDEVELRLFQPVRVLLNPLRDSLDAS